MSQDRRVLSFIDGHWALLLGAVAFSVTLALWRWVTEPVLRRDLGGAVVLFAVFLLLRLGSSWIETVVPPDWLPYVHLTWMLAFAYGSIRLLVSLALFIRRRVLRLPTAKIHRDVADSVLYLLVTIALLKTQLHLDVGTLLGTSAVLSLVLGFALQDTLGNFFSGLSLQLEHPFQVGDFIKVGEHEGRVVQVTWRSCRIETVRHEYVTLPNSVVAKEHVVNFGRGEVPVAVDLNVGASYDAPPNLVKAAVNEALLESPLVLPEPPPSVRLLEFGDSSVNYLVRVFIKDYAAWPSVHDEVLSRLWYRFGRAGIEIPFPQRVVTMKQPPAPIAAPHGAMLDGLEIFAPFTTEERQQIAETAVERRFGAGESVVVEGREGDTFYVVLSGRLSIRVGKQGKEVTKIGRGESFGEMSLLTGEPRAATIVATEDSVLLELSRPVFAKHFAAHPERTAPLAELLAKRRAAIAELNAEPVEPAHKDATRILERLRAIFRLRA